MDHDKSSAPAFGGAAKALCEAFEKRFPEIEYFSRMDESSTPDLIIPCPNQDIGTIDLFVNEHEIIVSVGKHVHMHIGSDCGAEEDAKSETSQVIEDTLHFLYGLFSGELLLRLKKKGGRLISASIVDASDDVITTVILPSGLLYALLPLKAKTLYHAFSGRPVDIQA